MPSGGVAVMMMEIEEMLALNFTLFSEAQIDAMPRELEHLFEIAERQTYTARGSRNSDQSYSAGPLRFPLPVTLRFVTINDRMKVGVLKLP
jgi:hypothetical protein